MRTDHQGRMLHQRLGRLDRLHVLEQRAAVIRHLLHEQEVKRQREADRREQQLRDADAELFRCERCGDWRLPYARRTVGGTDGRFRVLGERVTAHRCTT